MIRNGNVYIDTRELNSILIYLYGLKTGQDIFDKIIKERCENERQDIFAK